MTICLRSDLSPDSCSRRTMGFAPLSPPPCSPSDRCSCRRRPRHPARDINGDDHDDDDDGDHDDDCDDDDDDDDNDDDDDDDEQEKDCYLGCVQAGAA